MNTANEKLNRDAFESSKKSEEDKNVNSIEIKNVQNDGLKKEKIDNFTNKTLREFNDDIDQFSEINPNKHDNPPGCSERALDGPRYKVHGPTQTPHARPVPRRTRLPAGDGVAGEPSTGMIWQQLQQLQNQKPGPVHQAIQDILPLKADYPVRHREKFGHHY